MGTEGKISLLGLTLTELQDAVIKAGLPKFTASQIADWIYAKRVCSIDDMTNISKKGRESLSALYTVERVQAQRTQKSKDGTIKYLFSVGDGRFVRACTFLKRTEPHSAYHHKQAARWAVSSVPQAAKGSKETSPQVRF